MRVKLAASGLFCLSLFASHAYGLEASLGFLGFQFKGYGFSLGRECYLLAIDMKDEAQIELQNQERIWVGRTEFDFNLVGSVEHGMALISLGVRSNSLTKEKKSVYRRICRTRPAKGGYPEFIKDRSELINNFVFNQLNPIDESLLKIYPEKFFITRSWRGQPSWSVVRYSRGNSGLFSAIGDIGITVEIDLGPRDVLVRGVQLTFGKAGKQSSPYDRKNHRRYGESTRTRIRVGLGQFRPISVSCSDTRTKAEQVECNGNGLVCLLDFPRIARTAQIIVASEYIDKLSAITIIVE